MRAPTSAVITAGLAALACIVALAAMVTMAGEEQQIVKLGWIDKALIYGRQYFWEIMACLAVLASLRATQCLKRIRFLPGFLYEYQDGPRGRKRKIRNGWLDTFATVLTFGLMTACLLQRYPDVTQVVLVAGILSALQLMGVKVLFIYLKARAPAAHRIFAEGLYTGAEDKTMLTRCLKAAVGGGVERRLPAETEDKTEPRK